MDRVRIVIMMLLQSQTQSFYKLLQDKNWNSIAQKLILNLYMQFLLYIWSLY